MLSIHVIKLYKKKQTASFCLLLFPNTFWVTKTDIDSYFPKPWNCSLWKAILVNASNVIKFRKKAQSASFVSAIVSRYILGHENKYCFIFPQALGLPALESDLSKCILLTLSSSFAKSPSQPVFCGDCFQTCFGSRKHILFHKFVSLGIACFGERSLKLHPIDVIKFRKKAQSASFFRLLFPDTFWVTRTDLFHISISLGIACFGHRSQ